MAKRLLPTTWAQNLSSAPCPLPQKEILGRDLQEQRRQRPLGGSRVYLREWQPPQDSMGKSDRRLRQNEGMASQSTDPVLSV